MNKGGRPAIDDSKKRVKKISFYLNEKEKERLDFIKDSLPPGMNINDFFRDVILHSDDRFFDFLGISLNKSRDNKVKSFDDFVLASELIKNIDMSEGNFYRILNSVAMKRVDKLYLDDLLLLKKSLNTNHYKKKLLIKQVDIYILKLSNL